MKTIINRADIIGGLKSVELAKKNPQNYQPGVGVSEDFKLIPNFKVLMRVVQMCNETSEENFSLAVDSFLNEWPKLFNVTT